MILRGPPAHVRSDNGPEFIATILREWIAAVGSQTAYIEPCSPCENGYCESFNSKLRDEPLNGEIFFNLVEAQVVIESWWISKPFASQRTGMPTAGAGGHHPSQRTHRAMGERASA